MVRKLRAGDFRATGHYRVRLPTGEIIRIRIGEKRLEEPPFSLTVPTGSVPEATREVLKWARGMAYANTRNRYCKIEILNIRVALKKPQNRTQPSLFPELYP